jgi:hypothetical protein
MGLSLYLFNIACLPVIGSIVLEQSCSLHGTIYLNISFYLLMPDYNLYTLILNKGSCISISNSVMLCAIIRKLCIIYFKMEEVLLL